MFMMKKTWLASLLLIPMISACQSKVDNRVVIPFGDEVKTANGAYLTLTEYSQLQTMVDQENTFILIIGNATCGCTVEFLPFLREWIQETKVVTYYLEYTQLEFQANKFGIPLLTGTVPIINIFKDGTLAYHKAYNPNRDRDNTLFYNLDLLTTWFNERIILPTFIFLTKANFDLLFTTNRKMIIYIGREDCPDCTYAFNTFVIPFFKANPNLPPIYGIDVMLNGIRVPQVTGQENTTGNNTPGWSEFKTNYGMDNQLNTTFGYATGFVPTFMYIETNGQSIQANPLIIKDMIVTYNDSSLLDPTKPFNNDSLSENYNPRTTSITRSFFDGTRPLQYTDLNIMALPNLVLPANHSTPELRAILEPYHNGAMQDFFDFYLPKIA
jgi:hypothetical protein